MLQYLFSIWTRYAVLLHENGILLSSVHSLLFISMCRLNALYMADCKIKGIFDYLKS